MDFKSSFQKTFAEALKLLQEPTWVTTEFCQYTSIQGLVGIVESNEIWLSDYRFVNDELEYEYGKQLALSTIEEAAASEANTGFKRFLRRLLESIKLQSGRGTYIGSMSLSPDRLDQWKGYGNSSESICIKFAGDFELWNTGNSHPSHLKQQKVIYDENEQMRLIRNIIEIYKENFDGFRRMDGPFLRDLTWLIESQFILFKHREYASEDELRLTIANLDQVLKKKNPRHRVAKGMVIPYVSTKYISVDEKPPVNRLPIREIIVSPTSRPELLESVSAFVANMDYSDVQISRSSIRFRG